MHCDTCPSSATRADVAERASRINPDRTASRSCPGDGRLAPRTGGVCGLIALSMIAMLGAPSSATAGPPFRTDDREPVEYQHWEVYTLSTAAHAQGDTAGILPGVEVNFGAAPNLQLHLIAPIGFDKPSGGSWQSGHGDPELA
jgi:hypothetical protein